MRKIRINKGELEKLYKIEKLNTYQIASKFNCCQATIWKRMIEFNVKRRKSHDLNSRIPSKNELLRLYIKNELSTWQIEKKYGFSRGTVHRKLKEYGIKIRDRADSHIIFPRKDFSGNLIEKAYLIGFRLGDLGVRKIYPNSKTIAVASGSTIKEQIELINNLFKNYGRIKIKTAKNNRINIWIALNESFDFLLSKEIPYWVEKNKETCLAFIAGFTDAEGSIGIYNKQAVFQIGNYEKPILLFILKNLNNFGIACRGPYECDTSNYFNKEGYGHNKNYFQIRVCKKESLLKLFNSIKPYIKHKNKIEALKKAEDNVILRNIRFKHGK
jgi:predicted DNA-binding protein (UPF0251 family)